MVGEVVPIPSGVPSEAMAITSTVSPHRIASTA
jgi:hypothetical protein